MPERVARRESIIEAAIQVISRRGFHAARISDIAREAGVADGTIYLYFRHKEDMLIAIFEEKMAELIVGVRSELERYQHPSDKLRCFVEFHFGQLARHRALAEVLQVELRTSSRFMKEYVPVRLTEYLDVLAEILEQGQREGVFRTELNPTIAKRVVFGALDELAMHWVLARGRRPDPTEAAGQVVEIFLKGLCHGSSGGDRSVSTEPEGPHREGGQA